MIYRHRRNTITSKQAYFFLRAVHYRYLEVLKRLQEITGMEVGCRGTKLTTECVRWPDIVLALWLIRAQTTREYVHAAKYSLCYRKLS